METGCTGCFPGHRKACDKALWARCCAQEVACHDDACRGEIFGQLKPRAMVRARATFTADDEGRAEIEKGMKGKIVSVDDEGDVLIKFWWEGWEEDAATRWVYKSTFWDNVELSGRPEGLRAVRVVKCLDNCTLAQECVLAPNEMTKKQQKVFGACVQTCKMETCQKDPACKQRFEAYALCKQRVSSTPACSQQDDEVHGQEL